MLTHHQILLLLSFKKIIDTWYFLSMRKYKIISTENRLVGSFLVSWRTAASLLLLLWKILSLAALIDLRLGYFRLFSPFRLTWLILPSILFLIFSLLVFR